MLTPAASDFVLFVENTCRLRMFEPSGRRKGDHGENKMPCFLYGCLKHYIVLSPPGMSHKPIAKTHATWTTLPDFYVNTWRHESSRVLPLRSVGKMNIFHSVCRFKLDNVQISLNWYNQPHFVCINHTVNTRKYKFEKRKATLTHWTMRPSWNSLF